MIVFLILFAIILLVCYSCISVLPKNDDDEQLEFIRKYNEAKHE